ncbi:1,5-anhydro-D-fructose reductase-like isoform X2 [Cephus cinctus]|nr:1,5-anhydro-D-fructose reductase-like isoform X2 [Cephus cinctus]
MAKRAIRLSSGYEMPILGLGTWEAKPEEIETAVRTALENGYRHIDTAFVYRNEEAIGMTLKKWFENGGKREELFVTTKLPSYGHGAGQVEKYLKLSLERLGLDYVDMYLIHAPFSVLKDENAEAPLKRDDGSVVLNLDTDPVAVWKEMEKQVKSGRARSIGLSNFNEDQILEIINNSEIKPSNLQVELHVYIQQKPLREFCKKQKIAVTAYSPLGSPGSKTFFQGMSKYDPDKFPNLLGHPVVQKIAEAHKKTTAQVLLRHLVQQGIIVIPKSSSPDRIKSNADIFDFELSNEELKQMDALDRGAAGRIFDFLFVKGVENHPHYPFKSELTQ